jgi:Flp pilus assembly protein TadG
MYGRGLAAQNRHARIAAAYHLRLVQRLEERQRIQRRGCALGPRTWRMPKRLRRRDERGAEMVEFALVVVLLIALLYGIVSYGLILAAQSTITQAAADGARSGIVQSSTSPCTSGTTPCAITTAEGQAANDVGWLNKGTCGGAGATTTITCVATEAACPSNASNQCLTVTVTYDYGSSPLFPELPGMGVITPSTISSSNTLQMSTPSS